MELHQACSPSRTDPDCQATYERAFAQATASIAGRRVLLVGLGCGGGQKDRRLVEALAGPAHAVQYLAVDVSAAMVITACQEVAGVLPSGILPPVVGDLGRVRDLESVLVPARGGGVEAGGEPARLLTFFGMIPNFEPGRILPLLADGLRAGDQLLFSANLAPGEDYRAGVERIMPLYDNHLTREWLLQFLLDAGVERHDGAMEFAIEADPDGLGLLKVTARFQFHAARVITVHGETFRFAPGEDVRLFFSYRYTPARIIQLLADQGLSVRESWLTRSGEEGVFLVRKSGG